MRDVCPITACSQTVLEVREARLACELCISAAVSLSWTLEAEEEEEEKVKTEPSLIILTLIQLIIIFHQPNLRTGVCTCTDLPLFVFCGPFFTHITSV